MQCPECREGSLLWHWPGVNASERIVHAVWLGESTVAALTTAGKIYTLPKQTGTPVTVFMQRLSVRHFSRAYVHVGSSACETCPLGLFVFEYGFLHLPMPQQLVSSSAVADATGSHVLHEHLFSNALSAERCAVHLLSSTLLGTAASPRLQTSCLCSSYASYNVPPTQTAIFAFGTHKNCMTDFFVHHVHPENLSLSPSVALACRHCIATSDAWHMTRPTPDWW